MREFKVGVFNHDGKRLSELTPAQREQAHEEWLRMNCEHTKEPEHIAFLLHRLDDLRDVVNELLNRPGIPGGSII